MHIGIIGMNSYAMRMKSLFESLDHKVWMYDPNVQRDLVPLLVADVTFIYQTKLNDLDIEKEAFTFIRGGYRGVLVISSVDSKETVRKIVQQHSFNSVAKIAYMKECPQPINIETIEIDFVSEMNKDIIKDAFKKAKWLIKAKGKK